MELLLEIVIELFGEVLLGAVVSIFDGDAPKGTGIRLYRLLGYLVLGCVVGLLSTLAFPRHTLNSPTLRVAWLAVAPLVGAFAMSLMKALRSGRPGWLRPWPMAYGAVLVGTVNLWRFLALE